MTLEQAAAGPIAIPGRDTTAHLLLRLAAGDAIGETVELRYDKILTAVASGTVPAGLIIHESRFTYAQHGLQSVLDLGAWWERTSGLPVPLGVICVRADVEPALASAAERALRDSVAHAFAHPADSRAYVRAHAQELSEDVCRQHIELYVNDFTLDLGDEGLRAVDALLSAAPQVPATPRRPGRGGLRE